MTDPADPVPFVKATYSCNDCGHEWEREEVFDEVESQHWREVCSENPAMYCPSCHSDDICDTDRRMEYE
jgi:hypothetical protein